MAKNNSNLLDILQMYDDAGVDETLKKNNHIEGHRMIEPNPISQKTEKLKELI